ncbi:MAG: PAS domain S-box protein, partial [Anaerolineae bacterium]|nr:PAS domain S-box protein [Anaerolineae bacterium]
MVMQAAWYKLREQWRVLALVCLVSLIGLVLFALALSWYQPLVLGMARQRLEGIAASRVLELQSTLQERLHSIQDLYTWVQDVQLDEIRIAQEFQSFAVALDEGMSGHAPVLAVAPGGITRWVYPPEVASDYARVDLRLDQRFVVRPGVQTVVTASPAGTDDSHADTAESVDLEVRYTLYEAGEFWGIVSAHLDVGDLFQEARAALAAEGIQIAAQADGAGVFWGQAAVFDQDPVVQRTTFAGGAWQIASAPVGGWDSYIQGDMLAFWFGSLAVVLLIAFVTLQNLRLQQRSAALVRLNETLDRSERRFRTIIQASADAIIGLNGVRQIVVFNRAAEQMFGYTEREVAGINIAQLLAMESRAGVDILFATPALQGGVSKIHEALGRHKDGTLFPIEASLSADEWGGTRIVVVSIRDVTARKKAAEALWRSEARYRSLTEDVLDSSAVGIFILDAERVVVWMNQALEEFFG